MKFVRTGLNESVRGTRARLLSFVLPAFASCLVLAMCPRRADAQPVIAAKELMITDLSVVDDSSRTANSCDVSSATDGALPAWSFGGLMQSLAGNQNASDFTLAWLRNWTAPQTVNGQIVKARKSIEAKVINPWLDASGGASLDLRKAPFRLLAISFRPDLRDRLASKGGELRFVFGLLDANCRPTQFTIIFEFFLPASSCEETVSWAERFHALGSIPFGPVFNAELERLTALVTKPNSRFARPNNSLLAQLRTNEIFLARQWEFREFQLISEGVAFSAPLTQVTVKQTPPISINNSHKLASYINRHSASIKSGTDLLPPPMLAGSAPVPFGFVWKSRRIKDPVARHQFALSTCSGCHLAETNTLFLHVSNRDAGQKAVLSGFLRGTKAADPVTGKRRSFSELKKRASDMSLLLNTSCGARTASLAAEVFCSGSSQKNNPAGPYGKRLPQLVAPQPDSQASRPPLDLSGLEGGCLAPSSFGH